MTRRETLFALIRRQVSSEKLAWLLNCIPERAAALLSADAMPDAREMAILRLCARTPPKTLTIIFAFLDLEHEWKPIPGFSRYEAHRDGEIRRAAGGHGSIPGIVLRQRASTDGHRYVNIVRDEDRAIKKVGVHRLVCLTFNGAPPSGRPLACHRNDDPADNRSANLYWGSHYDNASDRRRNARARFDTDLTQRPEDNPAALKKWNKKQMLARLERARRKKDSLLSLGRGVPLPFYRKPHKTATSC